MKPKLRLCSPNDDQPFIDLAPESEAVAKPLITSLDKHFLKNGLNLGKVKSIGDNSVRYQFPVLENCSAFFGIYRHDADKHLFFVSEIGLGHLTDSKDCGLLFKIAAINGGSAYPFRIGIRDSYILVQSYARVFDHTRIDTLDSVIPLLIEFASYALGEVRNFVGFKEFGNESSKELH